MKFMYDPDFSSLSVEGGSKQFEVTEEQAKIIAMRNAAHALDQIAEALFQLGQAFAAKDFIKE